MKSIVEVFLYFLRLGLTGFGGPLAIVAIIQHDLVEKKKWLSELEFSQALSLLKAMPGALSFQTAVYIGRHRAGFVGGTVAGVAFLFPSVLLMIALGYSYQLSEKVIGLRDFLNGMQAGAVVLMIQGLRFLSWPYLKNKIYWFFFLVGSIVFIFEWISEPLIILSAGAIGVLWGQRRNRKILWALPFGISLPGLSMTPMFEFLWVNLKSGAVIFGTGLAIVPLLEREFVHRLQWISGQQFLDAVALGQVTPGPLLVTVTFVGFIVFGLPGAILGTIAVFLPGFIHMQTWFPPLVSYLGKQKWVNDFLVPCLGVICGVLFITIFRLTNAWGDEGLKLIMVAMVSGIFLVTTRSSSWLLILIAGGLGLFI